MRDGVAYWLNIDERDPQVASRYSQCRGDCKQYAVEVYIKAGWLMNARQKPVIARPYELRTGAKQCAELAIKARWQRVEVVELRASRPPRTPCPPLPLSSTRWPNPHTWAANPTSNLQNNTGLDILPPWPLPESPTPSLSRCSKGRSRSKGSSLKDIRDFPPGVKDDVGYQLHKVQLGEQPDDFKPMPRIGPGVEEIRVKDDDGIYRVIYTARFDEAVYVLHAFEKRAQKTLDRDIELAKDRLSKVLGRRQKAATAAKKGLK